MNVDIPHKLGRDEAARRLREGTGRLGEKLPAGADVRSHWTSDNDLDVVVTAMGQKIDAKVAVLDDRVNVQVKLPAMLSFFGGAVESAVRETGTKLLGGPAKK